MDFFFLRISIEMIVITLFSGCVSGFESKQAPQTVDSTTAVTSLTVDKYNFQVIILYKTLPSLLQKGCPASQKGERGARKIYIYLVVVLQ